MKRQFSNRLLTGVLACLLATVLADYLPGKSFTYVRKSHSRILVL